jgi:hypothetical protein
MRQRAREPAVLEVDLAVVERRDVAVGVACVRRARRDVHARLENRVGHLLGRELALAVLAVGELLALAVVVVRGALGLRRADRVLGEDRRRPARAVDHPLHRADPVGGDEVVAVQSLRVQRVVDKQRERLPGRLLVEADDRQVVVGVRVRIAGGAAVVGERRAHRVSMGLVEVGRRCADADVLHLRQGVLHRSGDRLREVVVRPDVEDVLERPRAPGGRRVVGRRVVVGRRDDEVRPVDAGAGELLRGAAEEEILREVEVVLDQREHLAAGLLHDDRAHRQPRLRAV